MYIEVDIAIFWDIRLKSVKSRNLRTKSPDFKKEEQSTFYSSSIFDLVYAASEGNDTFLRTLFTFRLCILEFIYFIILFRNVNRLYETDAY